MPVTGLVSNLSVRAASHRNRHTTGPIQLRIVEHGLIDGYAKVFPDIFHRLRRRVVALQLMGYTQLYKGPEIHDEIGRDIAGFQNEHGPASINDSLLFRLVVNFWFLLHVLHFLAPSVVIRVFAVVYSCPCLQ